ncbi:hypothetical protein KDK_70220 [Dictyobacter kobayashii]|uniref:Uncharacterized protein n=2 Tax=Dictyobacter kobayashii TaxID=2014872 RepID=A0A402AVR8_9CHLR|nr:hypothetical protein KDK_70220 [Dictyobacter kobayashii]
MLGDIAADIPLDHALYLLSSIRSQDIEFDFRLNERPLAEFIDEVQVSLNVLTQLKDHEDVSSMFIKLCELGLLQDDASRKLSTLLRLSEDLQNSVRMFIQTCTLSQLHTALVLASMVDQMQYERSQEQLRVALNDASISTEDQVQSIRTTPILKQNFTRKEVAVLVDFSRRGFRLSVDQFNAPFLAKIAEHLPDLYKQLEVRLQRG